MDDGDSVSHLRGLAREASRRLAEAVRGRDPDGPTKFLPILSTALVTIAGNPWRLSDAERVTTRVLVVTVSRLAAGGVGVEQAAVLSRLVREYLARPVVSPTEREQFYSLIADIERLGDGP